MISENAIYCMHACAEYNGHIKPVLSQRRRSAYAGVMYNMRHVLAATTLLMLNVKTTGMLCRSCVRSNLHLLPLSDLSSTCAISAAFQVHSFGICMDAGAPRVPRAACCCRPKT